MDGTCTCGHGLWEHEVEEYLHSDGDESLIFNACTVEDCPCNEFEDEHEKES